MKNLNNNFKQYEVNAESRGARLIFSDIKKHLLDFIEEAECVVGCVAWITDKDIIDALSKKRCISIIVQKEPLYHQESRTWLNKASKGKGEKIKANMLELLIYYLDGNGNALEELDRFRCVGYTKKEGIVLPLMHHKFLVSCELKVGGKDEKIQNQELKLVPKKFWSGSYNFSVNAGNSLENAIVGSDKVFASSFFWMWQRIYTISESLESKSKIVSPDIIFDESIFDYLKDN